MLYFNSKINFQDHNHGYYYHYLDRPNVGVILNTNHKCIYKYKVDMKGLKTETVTLSNLGYPWYQNWKCKPSKEEDQMNVIRQQTLLRYSNVYEL